MGYGKKEFKEGVGQPGTSTVMVAADWKMMIRFTDWSAVGGLSLHGIKSEKVSL